MNRNESTPFSVRIIRASAGTGKTHRLTQEFIKTLTPEEFINRVKRIVAITFTEKAACEMKERIVYNIFNGILKDVKDEKTYIEYENQLFLLRISTIHSFCKSLLKRFSFLFNIDPNFSVCEPEEGFLYFNQALTKFLQDTSFDDEKIKPLQAMKLRVFLDNIRELEKTHPQVFLGTPAEAEITKPIYKCFLEVKKNFQEIKEQNSVLDFNDLEIFTYNLLKNSPQSLNILYDFDEAVDFIFVDEFQDTSLLQWNILKEFSEEWRSGFGAKAEVSTSYGLFLVGDKKQSIYLFRGAEPTVFNDAGEFYGDIVKNEFLTNSHRSFEKIISFVNSVFEGNPDFPEKEKLVVSEELSTFDDAFVEIKTFGNENGKKLKISEEKQIEYDWVADKIISLINEKFPVYDRNKKDFSKIRFRDIAIIMRKRTHLGILEEQLRSHSIPFVNVGGIGFYQEPEIVFLVSLICVLADPSDTFLLHNLNNSIFHIDREKIDKWRELFRCEFPSSAIDRILCDLDIHSYLGQQGYANIEKFLMLIHEMEHLPFFEVARNIRMIASRNEEEPKADIFSERQDAVRVLTVHGSKGLEFPVVFLTGIEQGYPNRQKINIMHDRKTTNDAKYIFAFRKKNEDSEFFDRYIKKMEKEEERTLYVALTRAKQGIVITGARNARKTGVWTGMLKKFEDQYPPKEFTATTFDTLAISSELKNENISIKVNKKPISPISFSSQTELFDPVNEKIGTIVHTIAFEISKGILKPERENAISRAKFLASKLRVIPDTSKFENHIDGLLSEEILKVIKPQDNAYSEIQFLIEDNGQIIEGTIDRVIIDGQTGRIYDIKTRKTSEIKKEDIHQLKIYSKGIKGIFGCIKIETFIIFTFEGIIKTVEL